MFWFRKKKPSAPATYEIMEQALKDGSIVPGVKILIEPYVGVIVTISPKVEVKEIEDALHVIFDFNIVSNPTGVEIEYAELKPIVGDIVVDIMQKDYNAS